MYAGGATDGADVENRVDDQEEAEDEDVDADEAEIALLTDVDGPPLPGRVLMKTAPSQLSP